MHGVGLSAAESEEVRRVSGLYRILQVPKPIGNLDCTFLDLSKAMSFFKAFRLRKAVSTLEVSGRFG